MLCALRGVLICYRWYVRTFHAAERRAERDAKHHGMYVGISIHTISSTAETSIADGWYHLQYSILYGWLLLLFARDCIYGEHIPGVIDHCII
jgi:hypothetical protein